MARSPLKLSELELMKKSVLFADEDVQTLRLSYDVVQGQVEAILDVWYGSVGANGVPGTALRSRSPSRPPERFDGAS